MRHLRPAVDIVLASVLLLGSSLGSGVRDVQAEALTSAAISDTVQVSISAPASTVSWDERLPNPEILELPLVFLHRQWQATDELERTVVVEVSGIRGGTTVEGELVSFHKNPSTGDHYRQSRHFSLPEKPNGKDGPSTLTWTFSADTMPSDFYRFALRDDCGELLWQNPDLDGVDLVALDAWQVKVGDHTVQITYGTLFPFARGKQPLAEQLPPEAVHGFVASQFVPMVIRTWDLQFSEWGFGPIHPEWDEDKVFEIYFTCPPFALFDGTGTYTVSNYADGRPYPQRRIWLRTNEDLLGRYDSLTNGFKVIFAHEFFHTVQWNARLSVGPAAVQWLNVIVEAQAIVASTVQYPEIELSADHLVASASQFGLAARRFLEQRMETSFAEMEADDIHRYDAALYWRFLYERLGDMGVFRAALEEMARRPGVASPAALDEIMDAALARVDGPLGDFEQSLAAFAQANYALRLENARCTETDLAACVSGYHDPNRLYTIPRRKAEITYRGTETIYEGAIPASYGSNMVEVWLSSELNGRPLIVECHSREALLSVQVWRAYTSDAGPLNPSRGLTGVYAQTLHPDSAVGNCQNGCQYEISSLELENCDRLVLIVVRLDPHEDTDPVGAYRLSVGPAA